MEEKVYTFYSSDRERDNAEAQKYLAMASRKLLKEAFKSGLKVKRSNNLLRLVDAESILI